MYIEYLISIVLAFIVSFSATPVARRIAFKIGAIDYPKDDRRIHKKPIALFGGAAIITGFLITVFYNLIAEPDVFIPDSKLWSLLVGIGIITIMGIIDDIKHIGPKIKLLFQIAAALSVVLISDTKISVLTNPFSPQGYIELSNFVSYPLTILWIVGITNAINLIDGLDGLAAGVSSISSLSLFFVSVLGVSLEPGHNTSILTAALAGATLGFLPFNFNPAKIFMGETGSAFLGFTLGVISIQGMLKSYATISIVIPLLVLGLPIFDTAMAIVRRLLNGKPVMTADRGHLHHRLIDMGLSQKQSVMILYLASAALGMCAIVLANKGALSAVILLITVSAFVIAGARYMSEISDDYNQGDNIEQENTTNNESLREKIIDRTEQNNSSSKIVVKDIKKFENP